MLEPSLLLPCIFNTSNIHTTAIITLVYAILLFGRGKKGKSAYLPYDCPVRTNTPFAMGLASARSNYIAQTRIWMAFKKFTKYKVSGRSYIPE